MEVLTINQECSFLINEREIKPEDLSKQDLLELFNTIYELDDINSLQIPDDVEINKTQFVKLS